MSSDNSTETQWLRLKGTSGGHLVQPQFSQYFILGQILQSIKSS